MKSDMQTGDGRVVVMRMTIRYILLALAGFASLRFLYMLRRGVSFEQTFRETIGYVDLPWATIIAFEFRELFTWSTLCAMVIMIMLLFRKKRPFWASPFSLLVIFATLIGTSFLVEAYIEPLIKILKIYRGG